MATDPTDKSTDPATPDGLRRVPLHSLGDAGAGERLAAIRVALALQPNDGTRSVAVLWPHDAEFLLSQLDARDARIATMERENDEARDQIVSLQNQMFKERGTLADARTIAAALREALEEYACAGHPEACGQTVRNMRCILEYSGTCGRAAHDALALIAAPAAAETKE